MKIEFTPEQAMEIGEVWGDIYLKNLPIEKVLPLYTLSERLAGLSLSERLAGVKPEEIEAYLKNIQRQKDLNGA